MNTSISISSEVAEKLEKLRADDEDFDTLIERLVESYRPLEAGAWEGTEKSDRAREAVRRSRGGFDD